VILLAIYLVVGKPRGEPCVLNRDSRDIKVSNEVICSDAGPTLCCSSEIRACIQTCVFRQHEGLRCRSLTYAERRMRPLARRAERTARPARVAIRARKPCFLARRRVLGW
jgi:hypothetical protein